MAARIDTPDNRARALTYLRGGSSACTFRVGLSVGLTTRQAYRLLRRMLAEGDVSNPAPGLWKAEGGAPS